MTTGDLETRTSSDHSSASETGSASSAPSSGTDEYLTAYQWAKKF
jgi:hypothetical protein